MGLQLGRGGVRLGWRYGVQTWVAGFGAGKRPLPRVALAPGSPCGENLAVGPSSLRCLRIQRNEHLAKLRRGQGHQSRAATRAGWLATCRSQASDHRRQSTGVHRRSLPRWLVRSSGEGAARAPRSGWGSLRLRGRCPHRALLNFGWIAALETPDVVYRQVSDRSRDIAEMAWTYQCRAATERAGRPSQSRALDCWLDVQLPSHQGQLPIEAD